MHPYRSLNAARLRLSGTGSWNLADHLDDILWLPFVEPGVLFHHVERLRQGPDVKKEDETENLELAKALGQSWAFSLVSVSSSIWAFMQSC